MDRQSSKLESINSQVNMAKAYVNMQKPLGGSMSPSADEPRRVADKSKAYESESSNRDVSFLNDLSQVNLNHHDKSFNEQLDDKTKFLLGNSEIHDQSHMGGHSHGGTVRQTSKRMPSNERGKIQRPRSSKGYRGAQQPISALGAHTVSAQVLPSGSQVAQLVN